MKMFKKILTIIMIIIYNNCNIVICNQKVNSTSSTVTEGEPIKVACIIT